jgi:uncharacterized protein (DUF58 family)
VSRAAPLLPGIPSAEELERAARILAVRSRREVSTAFAGGYRSAFRGGGVEFEESRPYVPGDDVRHLDWNALARTGEAYVKRFREERDQTLVLALDVSGSMAFGSAGRSKAAAAAHAAALLAGAASRAGDRVGFATLRESAREEVAPERGEARLLPLVRRLAQTAASPSGAADLPAALAALEALLARHAVLVLLSDFRDEGLLAEPAPGGDGAAPACLALARLARRHDVVAAVVEDPREAELPAAGAAWIGDPERAGRRYLLRTGAGARERYRSAAAARRRSLERALRRDGADVLWLRTDRDPLRALARFFARRPARAPRVFP